MPKVMKHVVLLLSALLLVLLTSISGLPSAFAASAPCFPETPQCISPAFSAYWQQNGGLPVFGFPAGPAQDEINRDTGKAYPTQWFERNRLEQHADQQAPYDILLGRLGAERLQQLGIDWHTQPQAAGPQAGCLWFPQTGHNVCDQPGAATFKTYYQTHGLQDSRLTTDQRSLALFGYPLTEPRTETNSSGDTVLTQWFERARFEWHPTNPDPYKVELGLLGNEVQHGSHLVATTIMGPAVVGGQYLFWHDTRNVSDPNIINQVIYGYDLHAEKEFLVSASDLYKQEIVSDGTTTAWSEPGVGSDHHSRIEGFDLTTRHEYTILESTIMNSIRVNALDHGNLYYADRTPSHYGTWARTLATGKEQLVLASLPGVMVDSGNIVWSESRDTGPDQPPEVTLHLRLANGSSADQVIAKQQGFINSFAISGDHIIWVYGSGASDRRVYLYSIAKGTTTPISTATNEEIQATVLSSDYAAWVRPPNPNGSWTITMYDVPSGTSRTVLELDNVQIIRSWAIVDGKTLVYSTVYPDHNNLYALDLGQVTGMGTTGK